MLADEEVSSGLRPAQHVHGPSELTRSSLCGNAEFVVVDTGGLMSDAAQLPAEERSAAQRAISNAGLPQVCASVRHCPIPLSCYSSKQHLPYKLPSRLEHIQSLTLMDGTRGRKHYYAVVNPL